MHTHVSGYFFLSSVKCSAVDRNHLKLQTFRIHPTTAGLQEEPFLSLCRDQGLVKMEAHILDRESKSYSEVFLSNWPTLNIS